MHIDAKRVSSCMTNPASPRRSRLVMQHMHMKCLVLVTPSHPEGGTIIRSMQISTAVERGISGSENMNLQNRTCVSRVVRRLYSKHEPHKRGKLQAISTASTARGRSRGAFVRELVFLRPRHANKLSRLHPPEQRTAGFSLSSLPGRFARRKRVMFDDGDVQHRSNGINGKTICLPITLLPLDKQNAKRYEPRSEHVVPVW